MHYKYIRGIVINACWITLDCQHSILTTFGAACIDGRKICVKCLTYKVVMPTAALWEIFNIFFKPMYKV